MRGRREGEEIRETEERGRGAPRDRGEGEMRETYTRDKER